MQDLRAQQRTTWLATLLLMLLAIPAFADNSPQLRITGNAGDAVSRNIRALVDLSRYPCEPPSAQYGLIRRQILANSKEALQAMGYYESALSLSTDHEDGCVRVTVDVQTGPAVILQRADIRITGEAANDDAFNRLVANAQLAIGKRLQHDQYSTLKKKPAAASDQPWLYARKTDPPSPQCRHTETPGHHRPARGQRPPLQLRHHQPDRQ